MSQRSALQLKLSSLRTEELEFTIGTRAQLTILMSAGVPAAFRLRVNQFVLRFRNAEAKLWDQQQSRRKALADWLSCAAIPEDEFLSRLRLALRQVIMP